MAYKATITIDGLDHTTLRANAESSWFELLLAMLHGTVTFELTNEKTGKSETVKLSHEVKDDDTVLRHMILTMIASEHLSDTQKAELEAWEAENLDGRTVTTMDWPEWETILGQKKPTKFSTAKL